MIKKWLLKTEAAEFQAAVFYAVSERKWLDEGYPGL